MSSIVCWWSRTLALFLVASFAQWSCTCCPACWCPPAGPVQHICLYPDVPGKCVHVWSNWLESKAVQYIVALTASAVCFEGIHGVCEWHRCSPYCWSAVGGDDAYALRQHAMPGCVYCLSVLCEQHLWTTAESNAVGVERCMQLCVTRKHVLVRACLAQCNTTDAKAPRAVSYACRHLVLMQGNTEHYVCSLHILLHIKLQALSTYLCSFLSAT